MKYLLTYLILSFQFSTSAQVWYELYPYKTFFNFETTTNLAYLKIDSISNLNNQWQIGIPLKSIFNYAVSSPKVIVTDSINTYDVNDTSIFIITIPIRQYATDYLLTGSYYVDSDSLKDFGKIEYSHNNGMTWVLLTDDTTQLVNSTGGTSFPDPEYNSIPTLTGSSFGWKPFIINLIETYDIFDPVAGADTALFRFSFISDSISESRDGLMFDNIQIVNIYAFGLEEVSQNRLNVYPNPARSDKLNINRKGINKLQVININCQLVLEIEEPNINLVDIQDLSPGFYTILGITNEGVFSEMFVRE